MRFISGLLFRSRVPDAARHSACRSAEPGPIQSGSMWVPALRPITRVLRGARDTSSNPRHIELRLHARTVTPERAVLADGIGTLENPVLPRRQPREDFRFHRLRPNEAQIGFH